MREIITVGTPFINPHWLNGFRQQRVIKTDNQVIIDNVPLIFNDDSTIEDGVEVEVFWNGRNFYAESVIEMEARIEKAKQLAEEARIKAAQERAERLKEAEVFNQALNIPVNWSPGIKDVLSGLTEKSNGDGQNARTVIHVLLEEALNVGRLKRHAGDFLCTAKSGSNGRAWSEQRREMQKVSCKACLALTKKWQDY